MNHLQVDLDTSRPKETVMILYFFGVLFISAGVVAFVVSLARDLLFAVLVLASGLLSGSILIALSLIVYYLYCLVMKEYFDAQPTKEE